jgi:uncharacterized membrane protein YdjX (TVP38/TMEM64 family)
VGVVDPERPIDPDYLVGHFVPDARLGPAGQRILLWLVSLTILVLAAAAWRLTPLHETLDLSPLGGFITGLQQNPAAPLLAVAAFVLAGLLLVPFTLLIVVSVLVFGPVAGFAYALAGGLASALTGYGVGSLLGRHRVRRLAGESLKRISSALDRRGTLTMVVMRVIPVASFTLINLAAGASHMSLRDFLLGSLLGMTPGILAIVILVDRLEASVQSPGVDTLLALVASAAAIGVIAYGLSKWLLGGVRQR